MPAELRPETLDALDAKGIDAASAHDQLARLRAPTERLPIDRAAVLGDGVIPLDTRRAAGLPTHRLSAFVPASGAATRMFAALHAAVDVRPLPRAAQDLLDAREGLAIGDGLQSASADEVLAAWVGPDGFASLPKGLVPLHRYPDHVRTAVEEHVHELAELVPTGPIRIHFTVPDGHQDGFQAAIDRAARHHGRPVDATLSVQAPHTDTLAITPEGELFLDESGEPLTRPGGHGALLDNLAESGGDLVLVRNIDNVSRESTKAGIVATRRALVHELIALEAEVHRLLHELEAGEEPAQAIDFAKRVFGRVCLDADPVAMARQALHRPIRVVGVVRNDGQPGGGPFWVHEPDGSSTPQIVEASQIDLDDPDQRAIFESATHFNPVDMVLALRDASGAPFDLHPLIDSRCWIRASKTHQGRPLRALERPGLWNGSMAGWNTVFVEVPSEVFNPVKSIADLLEPAHRGQR